MNPTNTRAQHVYEQLGFTRVQVNENFRTISWEDSSPQLMMSCIKRISSATGMEYSMAVWKPFAKRYKHGKTSGIWITYADVCYI